MTIQVLNTFEDQYEALVIPVIGNGTQEKTLSAIEATTGIAATMLKQDFKGEIGEINTIYATGKRVYLLGLGNKPEFGDIIKAFRYFSHKMRQKLPPKLGVSFLHNNISDVPSKQIEAVLNGLLLGAYQIGRYKTSNGEQHPFESEKAMILVFVEAHLNTIAEAAAYRAKHIAATQIEIFNLVNAPSNKKTPDDLVAWAKKSGDQYGYRVESFSKEQAESIGLHALLAVNRGSEYPPAFIIMEYKPQGNAIKKLGLIGKGVTFDTGGLSIKPAPNMHLMKSDMGGAAAVFGAMELAAKFKLPLHVIGIVPATDNSVDAKSLKPSDVIGSYSGKTIEVLDTDAEGRLILADGLSYMVKNFQPDILIDLATLTGSTVRTFGYQVAGFFSNNDELASHLFEVGERCSERIWRLPIWDAYKDDIKSDIADVRNLSGKPVAGAISAAKFLEFFIDNHPAWAHLDIAGVVFNDSEFASQKSATAFGVRFLFEFMTDLAAENK